LAQNDRAQALSELVVLSANLPDAASPQVKAGQLYLKAAEPRRGLEHFRRALRTEPKNPTALEGAGKASFDAGDYKSARHYLRAAPASSEVARLLGVSESVLAGDPHQVDLSFAERRHRLAKAVRRARERIDECLSLQGNVSQFVGPFTSLRGEAAAFEPSTKKLHLSSATIEAGMHLVYRVEQQTARACPPSTLDRALLLIGRQYEFTPQ
jgi:hypothetical protein